MTQAFEAISLYAKSKVYIGRAIAAQKDGNLEDFQLWASLSIELLGKAALAEIHPVLVADPDNIDSLFAACGKPFSVKRRSIMAKTVFERLSHVSKQFLKDEQDFCMELANRRNAELHSGELPFVGMRAIAWVPKMWKVCKIILESQNKTLIDWIGAEDASAAEEEIAKAPTLKIVYAKLKASKAKFESKFPTEADRESIRTTTTFDYLAFLPLFKDSAGDSYDAAICPACGCKCGISGEEWSEEITNAEDPEEPWLEFVDTVYVVSALRCKICELKLDGQDELEIADVQNKEFMRTELREADYEPDYGND